MFPQDTLRKPGCSLRGSLLALRTLAAVSILFVSFGVNHGVSLGSQPSNKQNARPNSLDTNTELQTGIALTREGHFADAIPHLLAARGSLEDPFAADFNLALCYVATGQNQAAIPILQSLTKGRHATASVYNLLTQALLGASRLEDAAAAFDRAAALDGKNEKLYLLVADSSMDHESYDFGLKVVSKGLQNLPNSARLHYERGILLSCVDRPDDARKDLQAARKLAPGTTIGFLAEAQEGLLNADMAQAIRAAREGEHKERGNYVLLTILGQALIRQGASPGQKEFAEARNSLEKAVEERPEYSVSQLTLGQLELMAGEIDKAIEHLSKARQLAPDNPAVYSELAAAYRREGKMAEAENALATLTGLNRQQAAKYKLDPPDHKGSYIGSSKQIN
ncbi:MAG TPA: tetratricopeptide repeat protein [Candidatus Acidoferrum sp.]|nr:tetratricopeptide repeat protein [Candidatus Acidoferrum sp.]